jgi:hypothetical protein
VSACRGLRPAHVKKQNLGWAGHNPADTCSLCEKIIPASSPMTVFVVNLSCLLTTLTDPWAPRQYNIRRNEYPFLRESFFSNEALACVGPWTLWVPTVSLSTYRTGTNRSRGRWGSVVVVCAPSLC